MKRATTILAVFLMTILPALPVQAATGGEKIFKSKCVKCHAVFGRGGITGPDLTTISAKMTENELKAKLEYPKKDKPASIMPSFKNLPKNNMTDLLNYLKTLKALPPPSGKCDCPF